MCILCNKHPATVPDRNRMGRPIKKVCTKCHSARLQEDIKKLVQKEQQK